MHDSPPWLLFVHQLPPKPDYLRVKVRRRLRAIGAALVKNTIYVRPNDDESLEDLEWLREEVEAAGGTALIAEAAFVHGISDEEIQAMLDAECATAGAGEDDAAVTDEVAPGSVWVTRQGVFVDRIASAWLVRRFIDPEARFKFVAARGYRPRPGELRFDMVGGEYTHAGEDCTFQTLLRRFGLGDPALAAVGEVVHDIDCKDQKFGRPETAGIAGLLRAVADAHANDGDRLDRGFPLFDDLYAFFSSRRSAP